MNKKPVFAFCLFFLCLVCALSAWGKKEAGSVPMPSTDQQDATSQMRISRVRVSGVVRLIGGGPIPELVITGNDQEWHIDREEKFLFDELQHQTVIVDGIETVTELRFANGVYAGERRTLNNIKIIAVE